MKGALAATGTLLADRDANAKQQVFRLLRRAEGGERRLRLAERGPLRAAPVALLEMGGDTLHLPSGKPAVKILRKSCLHCTAAVHRASSPRDISSPVRPRAWLPLALDVKSALRQARPRTSRDLTVPRFTPCISATSSYTNPSMSRRMSVVRKGSGTCASAASTRARFSAWTAISNGDSEGSTSISLSRRGGEPSPSDISCSMGTSCCL